MNIYTSAALALLSGALLFCPSCIKENRVDCPTYILPKVTNTIPDEVSPETPVTTHVFDSKYNIISTQTSSAISYAKEEVVFPVNRNNIYYIATFSGNSVMQLHADSLLLVSKQHSDALYGFSKVITVGNSDYGYIVPKRLCKHFANVSLHLCGATMKYKFRFEFQSTTSGIHLPLFEPIEGKHTYHFEEEGNDNYHTTIVRQFDFSTLVLDVYRRSAQEEEALQYRLPIGRDLQNSGYRPNAEDMQDITMELDYSEGGIVLIVNGWKLAYSGDYII